MLISIYKERGSDFACGFCLAAARPRGQHAARPCLPGCLPAPGRTGVRAGATALTSRAGGARRWWSLAGVFLTAQLAMNNSLMIVIKF